MNVQNFWYIFFVLSRFIWNKYTSAFIQNKTRYIDALVYLYEIKRVRIWSMNMKYKVHLQKTQDAKHIFKIHMC